MRGFPWRSVGLAVMGAILVVVAYIPDPTSQELSTWSTQQLIQALESDRATLRRAVVGQLVARAHTDIPDLERAATHASGMQLRGVLDVLEELMLSPNADIADAAESALERLARPPQSKLADSALRVLFSNGTLRHARALAKCQELGAQVVQGAPIESNAAYTARPTAPPVVNRILVLDENWTGGDDGLRYATRLFPGEVLALHVGSNAAVTDEGLREVQMRRSYVYIRREGEPCLGIVVDYQGELGAGVRISDVIPGSPAAVAGLRRGDVIYEQGGRRVASFAGLRRLSLNNQPGDRIEMRVHRGNQSLRVKLALGSDFATGDCQCVAAADADR